MNIQLELNLFSSDTVLIVPERFYLASLIDESGIKKRTQIVALASHNEVACGTLVKSVLNQYWVVKKRISRHYVEKKYHNQFIRADPLGVTLEQAMQQKLMGIAQQLQHSFNE